MNNINAQSRIKAISSLSTTKNLAATGERLGAEGCKRVGERNAFEGREIGKRACGNCGDRSAVDGPRDGQVFR